MKQKSFEVDMSFKRVQTRNVNEVVFVTSVLSLLLERAFSKRA